MFISSRRFKVNQAFYSRAGRLLVFGTQSNCSFEFVVIVLWKGDEMGGMMGVRTSGAYAPDARGCVVSLAGEDCRL